MAKVTLKATGGLNSDVDLNNLPSGDYLDANNIILESGKLGGALSVKLIESIDRVTSVSQIGGTIKATFQHTNGTIYVLTRLDATYAEIYSINKNLDTVTLILKYNHDSASETFVPDIKVLGDTLVWNYANEGEVLSFDLKRTLGATILKENLSLIKATPNNVATIYKVIDSNNATSLLESNDFQFAFRYKYDSGEFSVLTNYSQMYYGEENVSKYTIAYDFSNKPSYAEEIEAYVRIGNNGNWRRLDSVKTDANVTNDWTGETFETLDTLSSSKPFDAIPIAAKHIEVAKNRIFLANIKDEYTGSASSNISISIDNGYSVPTGGTDISYFSTSTVTSPSSSEISGTTYIKPFANNSTYAIGVAYYDGALRTRGVEKFERFTTGEFGGKIIPDITITQASGFVSPDWAEYFQLVYTENLSKSYILEGYASNVFFELLKKNVDPNTGETIDTLDFVQSITNDDLRNVSSLVVDLMGMFNAGQFYTYNQGDKILLKLDDGTLLDLEITGLNNTFLFCRYTGNAITNPEIPNPSKIYFEIYTPKAIPEDEDLVFYEYGSLMPYNANTFDGLGKSVTASGSLNDNKIIGDMVFSTFEMPKYKESPFTYTYVKDEYATVVDKTITAINDGNSSGQLLSYLATYYNTYNSPIPTSTSVIKFDTNTGTSVDGDAISSFQFVAPDFFFTQDQSAEQKIEISYNLRRELSISLASVSAGSSYYFSYLLSAQVYKVPYNNITDNYGTAVKYGDKFDIITEEWTSFTSTTPTIAAKDFSTTLGNGNTAHQIITLSKNGDINAGDKFYIEFNMKVTGYTNVSTSVVQIKKNSTATNAVEFKLVGKASPSKIKSTYSTDADLEATKDTYLVRAMSNSLVYSGWNTSKGKPTVSYKKPVSDWRINSIRYSGTFVAGTAINNLNSFSGLDSNDIPIENGQINSIQRANRLQGAGDMLLALCERETSYIFLGEQELSQGNNLGIRALTQNMIGTIRNLGDNLGLLDKRSVYNYKGTIYWWDDYSKKVCEFTDKGLTLISDSFMQSAFLANSGVAKMAYDPYYDILFVSIGSQTVSRGYSKSAGRWRANYNFVPDFAESFGDRMIVFKNGYTYKSLGSSFSTYFGTAYDGQITHLLNSGVPVLLQNMSVYHNMSVMDYSVASNNVKQDLLSVAIQNEKGQTSQLVEGNFIAEDNILYSHILRDTSKGGTNDIVEGDYMVGYLNKFIVSLKDNSQQMNLDSINIEVEKVSGH